MKKLYFFLPGIFFFMAGISQPALTVMPGTDLALSNGTTLSIDGLYIIPSSGFTVNGLSVSKTNTVSHSTSNPYVSRVYQFSASTAPFNGTIRLYYQQSELNGLTESSLQVNIHDGSSWKAIASATNDVTNNYVETVSVSGQALNELTLADQAFALPLRWGLVSAYRESRSVRIGWNTLQEENVSHFSVERSTDAINWSSIADHLPARNTLFPQQYNFTDDTYSPLRLFYRIRQTDIDGHFTFSRVVMVSADNESRMLVYPNPVISGFYISNINPARIKQLNLFNSAGIQVKTWRVLQSSNDMGTMPAGIYQLQVVFNDGQVEYVRINKQ